MARLKVKYTISAILSSNGKAKYYHQNGILKGEINFFDGKKSGAAKYYYSNGELEGHVEYFHDSVNGPAKWYFSNGQLKSKSFWVNGRQYGSAYFYNETGNLITYQCVDFVGDAIYVLKVDENGYRIREQGAVFSYNFQTSPDTSVVRIGIPVTFNVTVSEPPGYRTDVRVQSIGEMGVIHSENYSVKNSTISVNKTFDKPGIQGVIIVGDIRDDKNTVLISDSVAFMINVKR